MDSPIESDRSVRELHQGDRNILYLRTAEYGACSAEAGHHHHTHSLSLSYNWFFCLCDVGITVLNLLFLPNNLKVEKKAPIKCATFGASRHAMRQMATGDFDGNVCVWYDMPHLPLIRPLFRMDPSWEHPTTTQTHSQTRARTHTHAHTQRERHTNARTHICCEHGNATKKALDIFLAFALKKSVFWLRFCLDSLLKPSSLHRFRFL